MILTEGQIKAQVRAIRKAKPSASAFALRSEGPWSGPPKIVIDGRPHRVAFCRSDLELRELLRGSAADHEPLVALCPLNTNDLGEDVRARLAKGVVHRPLLGDVVGSLFQATAVDPRVLTNTHLTSGLIEYAPAEGYTPVAGGVLDLQTAWCELVSRALGDREVATSISRFLEATLDAGFRSRLEKIAPELRREFFNWAGLNVDRAATWMSYLANSGKVSDLIPFGLLLGLIFDPSSSGNAEVASARVRLESWLGGLSIDGEAARG